MFPPLQEKKDIYGKKEQQHWTSCERRTGWGTQHSIHMAVPRPVPQESESVKHSPTLWNLTNQFSFPFPSLFLFTLYSPLFFSLNLDKRERKKQWIQRYLVAGYHFARSLNTRTTLFSTSASCSSSFPPKLFPFSSTSH